MIVWLITECKRITRFHQCGAITVKRTQHSIDALLKNNALTCRNKVSLKVNFRLKKRTLHHFTHGKTNNLPYFSLTFKIC